jgi:hypothetical protein
MRPSFLSHIANGLLLLVAFIILCIKHQQIQNETSITNIVGILLLLSIAVGVHGIMHHYEEIYYGFNPLVGKWKMRDDMINQNR